MADDVLDEWRAAVDSWSGSWGDGGHELVNVGDKLAAELIAARAARLEPIGYAGTWRDDDEVMLWPRVFLTVADANPPVASWGLRYRWQLCALVPVEDER